MIARQLDHRRAGSAAGQQGALQGKAGEDGDQDADDVEQEDQILPIGREEGGGEEGIDGHPSAAGHEGNHHDGGLAVPRVGENARSHHTRHTAAEAHQQRQEGLSRQTDGAHEPVHHEGRARHVAAVLQHRQEQKETADDGNEGGDRLDAAADPVRQDHREPRWRG